MREFTALGLAGELLKAGIENRESRFYNRFGQLIYAEPLGRHAGYAHPQYSIHRARLHAVLHRAVSERLGASALVTGSACTHVTQDAGSVTAHLAGMDSVSADALLDAAPPGLRVHDQAALRCGKFTVLISGFAVVEGYAGQVM